MKYGTDSGLYLTRKILLSKGNMVTPRLVSMSCAGKCSVNLVIGEMNRLSAEGSGYYYPEYICPEKGSTRKVFIKRPTEEMQDTFIRYGISQDEYDYRYNESDLVYQKTKKNVAENG